MGDIRFSLQQGRELFLNNRWGLEHMGDVNVENTFLNVWSKNLEKIRFVSFELFKKEGGFPKIEMTFDLDKKTISLDNAQDIGVEKIEIPLMEFFDIEEVNNSANKWWKYTHPAWWIWVIILFVFKDGVWKFFQIVWEHKLISGLFILIMIPLLVQLLANYLSYKWGWSK